MGQLAWEMRLLARSISLIDETFDRRKRHWDSITRHRATDCDVISTPQLAVFLDLVIMVSLRDQVLQIRTNYTTWYLLHRVSVVDQTR